jgi:hypothetical protein
MGVAILCIKSTKTALCNITLSVPITPIPNNKDSKIAEHKQNAAVILTKEVMSHCLLRVIQASSRKCTFTEF